MGKEGAAGVSSSTCASSGTPPNFLEPLFVLDFLEPSGREELFRFVAFSRGPDAAGSSEGGMESTRMVGPPFTTVTSCWLC